MSAHAETGLCRLAERLDKVEKRLDDLEPVAAAEARLMQSLREYEQKLADVMPELPGTTIVQEMDAGLLAKIDGGYFCVKNGKYATCSSILLPVERYNEYRKVRYKGLSGRRPVSYLDIPVYSWNGDHIHYCAE